MKAELKKQQDISIISVGGTLDIEETQAFRQHVVDKFSKKKLIFNLQEASFVGSTGLAAFMDTLRDLSSQNGHGIKMVGLRSEFRRIVQNLELQNLEFHENEQSALESFTSRKA